MSDLTDYLDACIGDTQGKLHIAIGYGGHWSDTGKYEFDRFVQSHFDYPAEREQAAREILAAAQDADAYVCTNLMVADKRAGGAAAARLNVKADIDGDFDLDKVRQIGGYAVASGTPGHAHVYVPLTETVPAHHYTALCRGLGAYLGNADSKISDNDVLRPPGTLNHKTRASGGESTKAEWLIRPPGVRHDKHALAHQLGIVLDETTETPGPAAATAAAEPVDVANYPLVQAALDHNTGDRSADTMRVVGACYDAGLTLAQTRYIVSSRTDLRDRLGERRDDDVLTCWLKAADKRQKTTFTDNNIPPGAPKQVVDGAQLLDNIKHFLARFIVYPTTHALVAHVLWIAHT